MTDTKTGRQQPVEPWPSEGGVIDVSYAPTPSGIGVAYIRFREPGPEGVAETLEIAPEVYMDVDTEGRPLGIELLAPKLILGGEPRGVTFHVDAGD